MRRSPCRMWTVMRDFGREAVCRRKSTTAMAATRINGSVYMMSGVDVLAQSMHVEDAVS